MEPMYKDLIEELDRALEQSRGVILEQADSAVLDAFKYGPGKCHENSADYARRHAGAAVVQGWIKLYDLAWAKHSVVKTGDQRYLDVTLRDGFRRMLVPHAAVASFCGLTFVEMPNSVTYCPPMHLIGFPGI